MKTNENKLLKTNDNMADKKPTVTWEAGLHYCVARFVVQRECNANILWSNFFFKRSMWEMLCRDHDLQTMNAVKR
jgi:hypothetical protein